MIEDLESKMKLLANERIAIDFAEGAYCVIDIAPDTSSVIKVNYKEMAFFTFDEAVQFALRYIAFGREIGERNAEQ